MKYLKSIKHPKFVWVQDHWDVHLSGTCIYKDNLCYFETEYPRNVDNFYYDIYKLSSWEKVKWTLEQKLFELCVGYHWTYGKDGRKWSNGFILRKPKWFFNILFNIYHYCQV